MKAGNLIIEKCLTQKGFEPSYKNRLAVSDELENEDRGDYEYIEDAVIDAVQELGSIGRLVVHNK